MTRYSRQTILPEIGAAGQEKLRQARVLCLGTGGLGSPALLYLAAAGIGTIGIVDPDNVALSNLHRQILFATPDVGELKVAKAAEHLSALNPEIDIHVYAEMLTVDNAMALGGNYDVLLDATDNFAAKFLINDVGVKLGLPVVYGSISGFEGQVSVFWARQGACYRCLHPHPPKQTIPNCAEAGMIGAVAGVIGSMQALEVIKLVVGMQTLTSKLYVFDARDGHSRVLQIPKKQGCPVCSKPPQDIVLHAEALTCVAPFTPEEISWQRAAQNEALIYLDVREEDEWRAGHVEGAIHLPLSLLNSQAGLPDILRPEQAYAIYCTHGIRSRQAAHFLSTVGLREVYSVKGGLAAR